ncbi:FabD/lysophospholipase-like protein [Aspergillus aculeatinus CBS 121060]|uniref:FabD/lysophospholipase-like protein n=1 Tax=Aspergillus aculeatinus CBS 121060 TaxID=1448322 RepID=A0ACD1GS25_9EURO|nr:FabD/lysophospholipase-like protein [Aspergillus aculeatinus CBS 121060]RAH64126.1 FabD/lysophospholipase-like protein [Aspergillus aculeatinus CBS 121060]
MPTEEPTKPLHLLSLDGGGVRGLSSLYILQQLMLDLQHQSALPTTPKPCDVFDMIAGTSTGGLIAILLGRLRLSVQESIDEYMALSEVIFGAEARKWPWQDGRFKATRLEAAIAGLVGRYASTPTPTDVQAGRDGDEGIALGSEEMLLEESGGGCKVFVCAKNTTDITGPPYLFRSYDDRDDNSASSASDSADSPLRLPKGITICEAARATSAAPIFFRRKTIKRDDDDYHEAEFVDGALGANNPTRVLLREAKRVFAPERVVGCVVSIGTGKKSISPVTEAGWLQRWVAPSLPLNTIRAQKDLATSCEAVADELERQFYRYPGPGVYFRFNVEQGVADVRLDDYKKLGQLKARTIGYLSEFGVQVQVKQAAEALRGRLEEGAEGSGDEVHRKCRVSDL